MTRVAVYCSACQHPGKARSATELGVCSKCGAARVRGVVSTGRRPGRPRLPVADRLRQQAEILSGLADELDAAELPE